MKYNTIMEIDLNILKNNTKTLCQNFNEYQNKIATLKDNAYGMGLSIVNTLINNGINYILVGSIKDALEIRKYNASISILVNYFVNLEEIYDAINNNITITIPDLEYLRNVLTLNIKDELKVHLLIDNSANKFGLKTEKEIKEAFEIVKNNKNIFIEGIYTNITTLGIVDENYYTQIANFIEKIEKYKSKVNIIHVNEPIMYHKKNKNINGISFDLALIGIEENIEDNLFTNFKIKNIEKKHNDLQFIDNKLECIFNITSQVMFIREAKKGDLIGKNYLAKEDMKVAIIPIGHKDGITKAIKYVKFNNKQIEILADDIDYMIIRGERLSIYDTVDIIGKNCDLVELMNLLKTNRYYLMSILNKNLKRVYVNENNEGEDYL